MIYMSSTDNALKLQIYLKRGLTVFSIFFISINSGYNSKLSCQGTVQKKVLSGLTNECYATRNNKAILLVFIIFFPLPFFFSYTENTMLVSFDITFIRRDQKQLMLDKAC